MNNAIECLSSFKKEIIDLGYTNRQKHFIDDAFSRWYINCAKTPKSRGLFPAHNIVNRDDLLFGNINKGLHFNITEIMNKSTEIYHKYDHKCQSFTKEIYTYPAGIATPKQLARLKNLYIGDADDFEQYRNKLLQLYKFIGINNMHLSIPPIFKGVELFGSPLNTHNDEYCSPFLLEKKFKSQGSFFNYKFQHDGIYLCNPPFDLDIIDQMATHLIKILNETKYEVIIIITIPVWDSATQKRLKIQDYKMAFAGYDALIECEYLRDAEVLDKDDYAYFNFYTGKSAPASWTHLITLSNMSKETYKKKFKIAEFMQLWRDFRVI